jgi:hypothetical protein
MSVNSSYSGSRDRRTKSGQKVKRLTVGYTCGPSYLAGRNRRTAV